MNKQRIPLEKESIAVCEASSKPPLIFQIPPEEGRQRLNEAQNQPVYMYPANIMELCIDTGAWGTVKIFLVSPLSCNYKMETIFYIHGAGWVFGNFHTHEKLVRELAVRTHSVVIFPEYSLSPEAKYPTAIEQCYHILCALPEIGKFTGFNLNLEQLTVAGDSVGGNMATVMTILSKFRNGPRIHKQLLYYPVTDACFNTESYIKFATDYYLYRAGMMWFWDQYTSCKQERMQITASPLKASLEELKGLPDAMVITDQADVLRDEGEAYAAKLLQAGVDVTSVRINAITHDFVMLNALDQTRGCRAAMDLSTEWINRKNYGCS